MNAGDHRPEPFACFGLYPLLNIVMGCVVFDNSVSFHACIITMKINCRLKRRHQFSHKSLAILGVP